MITVTVAPELIEQWLTTGSKIIATRVVDGIPQGATLLQVKMNAAHDIELHFSDPEPGGDRVIDIQLQSLYQEAL